jgi:hypothetical protein
MRRLSGLSAALSACALAASVFPTSFSRAEDGPELRRPAEEPRPTVANPAPVPKIRGKGAGVDSQEDLRARVRRLERLTEERLEAQRDQEDVRAANKMSRAVNGELKDIAHALRSLDQSFYLRGLQSKKAGTASSAYMDWRAKGIDLPRSARVVPPPPRYLGCGPKCAGCEACQILPQFAPPCDGPACAEIAPAPLAATPKLDLSNLFTYRTKGRIAWKLLPDASARVDEEGCLIAGMVRVTAIEERIATEVQAAGRWTMGLDLVVAEAPAPRTVLLASGDAKSPQFLIVLEDQTLSVTLRTGTADQPRTTTVPLMKLAAGAQQVAVTYSDGKLTGWVNGEPVATSNLVWGGLECWTAQSIVIGGPQFDGTTSARIRSVVLTAQSE